MRIIIAVVVVFCSLGSYAAQKKFGNCREIEPVELNAWITAKQKILLIDVRQTKEFQKKHLPTAISAYTDKDLKNISDSIDSESVVVVYGTNTDEGFNACFLMAQYGLTSVYSLRGGFDLWRKLGYK